MKKESGSVSTDAKSIDNKLLAKKCEVERIEKSIKNNVKTMEKVQNYIETLEKNIFKSKKQKEELSSLKKIIKKDYSERKNHYQKAVETLSKAKEG